MILYGLSTDLCNIIFFQHPLSGKWARDLFTALYGKNSDITSKYFRCLKTYSRISSGHWTATVNSTRLWWLGCIKSGAHSQSHYNFLKVHINNVITSFRKKKSFLNLLYPFVLGISSKFRMWMSALHCKFKLIIKDCGKKVTCTNRDLPYINQMTLDYRAVEMHITNFFFQGQV